MYDERIWAQGICFRRSSAMWANHIPSPYFSYAKTRPNIQKYIASSISWLLRSFGGLQLWRESWTLRKWFWVKEGHQGQFVNHNYDFQTRGSQVLSPVLVRSKYILDEMIWHADVRTAGGNPEKVSFTQVIFRLFPLICQAFEEWKYSPDFKRIRQFTTKSWRQISLIIQKQ